MEVNRYQQCLKVFATQIEIMMVLQPHGVAILHQSWNSMACGLERKLSCGPRRQLEPRAEPGWVVAAAVDFFSSSTSEAAQASDDG